MRNLQMETYQSTTHTKTRQNKKSPLKRPKHPIICNDAAMESDLQCLPTNAGKSKRYNHKSAHSKLLTSGRGKQSTTQEMKQMIAQLQKQLRIQQNRKHKKEEQNRQLEGQQNNQTTRLLSPKHKQQTNSQSQHRFTKYNKQESLSLVNANTYRNVQSPTLLTSTKRRSALSSKLMKSTQDTFRMLKDKKKNRRNNMDSDQILGSEQYVLLEDGFIEVNPHQLGVLNEKMKKNQHLIPKISTSDRQNHLKQIIFPDQSNDTDSKLSNYIEEDISEGDQQNYLRHESELFINTVINSEKEDFLISIIRIQKWWKKLLLKKKSNKQLISTGLQHEIPQMNIQSQISQIFDSEQLNFELPPTSNRIENKTKEAKFQKINNVENSLQARIEAAKKQRSIHHSFLKELLSTKKITQEYFDQKELKIESNYLKEIQEIERIKNILNQNMLHIKIINEKIIKDKQVFHSQIVNSLELSRLEDIFGIDSPRKNKKDELSAVPILPRDDIVNRQKSKGYHFAGDNDIRSTLYGKTDQYDIELCESDFEEDLAHSHHNQGAQNIISQQSNNFQSYDANFKEILDELKVRQLVNDQIEKRAAIQMGALPQQNEWSCEEVAIGTSLNSIHRFLLGFFKFYIYYYKDEFLRLINMPFGYNIDRRIKSIQGYQDQNPFPQQDDEGVIYGLQSVISDDILDQFYEKIYGNQAMNQAQKANFQFQKIHNKVIFDGFNEALNYFRPYYLINGPPYPWNNSEKALTFYFIAEQNIQEVFEKTQFKVLKWASSLCGIFVGTYSDYIFQTNAQLPVITFDEVHNKSCHPLVAQARDQRLLKEEKMEFIDNGFVWMNFDEEKTSFCFELSQFMFTKIIQDMVSQISILLFKNKNQQPAQTHHF